MKVRKKSCRHCMFSKNALGNKETLSERRAAVCAAQVPFRCHEHSESIVCAGLYARMPELFQHAERIPENGDLKHMFSNLTREEMNNYTYGGI